ncbi:hypothetical protein [Nitrosomonas halophila]|uniref:Thymidylate kinase n=1 Tax=Nitrosomonas halophila TaxID=44576 RepID=A0A1H3CEG2_9PROT|nr:hypothetical protein [Nitrosomonas halophila]SDX52582.1 hypothetical protein SAMN05421881_10031 [Nitrosomonas halophila]
MHNKTIVEFIGVSGSGKTTLASALFHRLSSCYTAVFPQRGEYRQIDLTFSRKLSIDLRYLPILFPYRLRRMIYEVEHTGFSLTAIRNGWARSRYPAVFFDLSKGWDAGLFILDEWLVHRTIDEDIHFYRTGFDYVRNFYLAPLMHINSIIFVRVEVDPKIAFQRILHDNQPYRRFALNKNKALIRKILAEWEQDVAQVSAALEAMQVPLFTINGSGPVDKNVEILMASLRQHIH